MTTKQIELNVTSEIGRLKTVMIHSPDGGIGNVPSTKIHDWLYDDIVDVEQMQKEYNYFTTILLLFLDSVRLFDDGKFSPDNIKYNPENAEYFGKIDLEKEPSCVIDTQYCLAYLFSKCREKTKELISSISTIESLNIDRKRDLQRLYREACDYEDTNPENGEKKPTKPTFMDLAKTFISGKLEWEWKKSKEVNTDYTFEKAEFSDDINYIFPPISNFIFTRDIGVTIKDHIFITKPRFYIRKREVVLLKFIAENFLLQGERGKIIELSEDDDFFQIEDKFKDESRVSFEGGDIMMISRDHILIGCSERTSPYAIEKFIHRVFDKNLVKLVSVIKISEKRSQMHIDTILSHLKKDTWIMFGQLSEEWQKKRKGKEWYRFEYADAIRQKSENQKKKEELVTVIQFYCCDEKHNKAKNYQVYSKEEIRAMRLESKILREEIEKLQTYEKLKESNNFNYTKPTGLKDLLRQISVNDFGVEKKEDVSFIYSGGGITPHDEREQWTDACNLLVLRPGIAVGYDRNKKTAEAFEDLMLEIDVEQMQEQARQNAQTKKDFKDSLEEERKKIRREKIAKNQRLRDFLRWLMQKHNRERFKQNRNLFSEEAELNFHVIHAKDLIEYFRDELKYDAEGAIQEFVKNLKDTLILLPSAELSRARGGSHCMTMPLSREGY